MPQQAVSLMDLFKKNGWKLGRFKPVAFIIPGLDTLVYLEKDCSYTTKHLPGSNISLLIENHVEGEDRIVGIQIDGISKVANFDIKERS